MEMNMEMSMEMIMETIMEMSMEMKMVMMNMAKKGSSLLLILRLFLSEVHITLAET